MSSILNPPCFWFEQGRCQLSTMPCQLVLDILRSNRKAQVDLQGCAGGSCPPPDPFYVTYVARMGLKQDPSEDNDAFQRRINVYRDNSKIAPGNQVILPFQPNKKP
jgi:hypothetical protein